MDRACAAHSGALCLLLDRDSGGGKHGYILPSVSDKQRVSLNLLTQQVFHVVVPLRRASFRGLKRRRTGGGGGGGD